MSNGKSLGMQQSDKTDARKMEMEKLRGKTGKEKQNEKAFSDERLNSDEKSSNNKLDESRYYNLDEEQNLLEEREHELDDLRNDRDDDTEDMNIDR